MAIVKRLDRVTVATTDLADAASLYQRNFGFELRQSPDDARAVLAIGNAEIHLVSGSDPAMKLAPAGEGMAALWLETDDVDAAADAFTRAGIRFDTVAQEDRRVLGIDPNATNQVPLFVFDRKASLK
jgi:hypothetical protein